jgi:hypothetical protein
MGPFFPDLRSEERVPGSETEGDLGRLAVSD